MVTSLKKSLSEEIFEQMKQTIFSRQWMPGERLPSEQKLMEMFGASRMSIREPLKQLAGLGLVESRRGAGTFVREFNIDSFIAPIQPVFVQTLTKQDVLDILEVREMEVVVVGIAAERAGKSGVEKLIQIQAQMENAQDDPKVHQETESKFHLQICNMTENPYFFQVCKLLYNTLNTALEAIVRIMGPQKAMYYHPLLIDTISKRYVHEAKAIMKEHLLTTVEAVRSIPEDADVFLPPRKHGKAASHVESIMGFHNGARK